MLDPWILDPWILDLGSMDRGSWIPGSSNRAGGIREAVTVNFSLANLQFRVRMLVPCAVWPSPGEWQTHITAHAPARKSAEENTMYLKRVGSTHPLFCTLVENDVHCRLQFLIRPANGNQDTVSFFQGVLMANAKAENPNTNVIG